MWLFLTAFAHAAPLAYYDLEGSPGGFVDVYAEADIPQWAWGPVANGPEGGFDGRNAWSTGLAADYLNDSTNCLQIPVPPLDGAVRPVVAWYQWYAIAAGDLATILVDDGTGWQTISPIYGYPDAGGWSGGGETWAFTAVDLTGLGDSPALCLRFQADGDGLVDDGWFVDDLGFYDGDVVPPHVRTLTTLADTEDLRGPYGVIAEIEDDEAVAGATLHWTAGGSTEQSSPMSFLGEGAWGASLPGQAPDTQVAYWVVATDGANEVRYPATGSYGFRVYLPAPVDLVGPAGRVVASTATLTWSPPDTTHPVTGYALYRNDAFLRDVSRPPADVPLDGGVDTFQVRALYDEGTGDPSNTIRIDSVLASIGGLSPSEGFRGDQLRLLLTGENLLLTQGAVTADLGDGIDVTAVDVLDVDRAWLSVLVAEDALPTLYDLSLTTPAGDLEAVGAFRVVDDADRPRLVSISPASAVQGASVSLQVAYAGKIADAPRVDLGEGIVVESVTPGDDQTVTLEVAVATDAPLGAHVVTWDDGTRVFSGVEFEVLDVAIDPGPQGCGLGLQSSAWAIALAGVMVGRRRRIRLSDRGKQR